LCPTVTLSHQDGHHSAVALLLKAALIKVSDYRLLGASGFFVCWSYKYQKEKDLQLPMQSVPITTYVVFEPGLGGKNRGF
jgi:hypothetical protein